MFTTITDALNRDPVTVETFTSRRSPGHVTVDHGDASLVLSPQAARELASALLAGAMVVEGSAYYRFEKVA